MAIWLGVAVAFLVMCAGCLAAIFTALGRQKQIAIWMILGVVGTFLGACVSGYQAYQSNKEQAKQHTEQANENQEIKDGIKGLEETINALVTANKTNDIQELKRVAEELANLLKAKPENVKTVNEQVNQNPGVKQAVTRAVEQSPKLVEAITQADPKSDLAPEEKTIIEGHMSELKGMSSFLVFKTADNINVSLRCIGGISPASNLIYWIGHPLPLSASFPGIVGGDVVVNGQSYKHLNAVLEFNAEPLLLEELPQDSLMTPGQPFTFQATVSGYANKKDKINYINPIFTHHFRGKGTISVGFSRRRGDTYDFYSYDYHFQ